MGGRPRVLVTRPEPGASKTAARLDALGAEVIKLPLQETRPLPIERETESIEAEAIALTSASAVRHAPPELVAHLAPRPCFAVGEATTKAARAAGFRGTMDANGDADALARAIIGARPDGPIAYLCGKVRRPVFEQQLAQAGLAVIAIETYDTVSLEPDASVAGGNPVDFVFVYSVNAALRMADAALAGISAGATFICISKRVSEALGAKAGKILVAEEPNEAAVLKLLGEAVKPAS